MAATYTVTEYDASGVGCVIYRGPCLQNAVRMFLTVLSGRVRLDSQPNTKGSNEKLRNSTQSVQTSRRIART